MKYPWLPEAQIEAAAIRLLCRAFGNQFSPAPLVDLDAVIFDYLAEEEQLVFDDDALLGTEDGDLILGKTLPLAGKILISRELKPSAERGRRRFTIAHELGHWVLHRPLFLADREHLSLFGANDFASVEMVSPNRQLFGAMNQQVRPEEWQANRFATALLIDRGTLLHAFTERFGTPPAARLSSAWQHRTSLLRDHSRLIARTATTSTPALSELFGLSVEAMAIALEARGYVTERPPALQLS
jgi:hypothetical protein